MSGSNRRPSRIRTCGSCTTRRKGRRRNIPGRITNCRLPRGKSNRIPTASNSACCSRCCRIRRAKRCQVSWPAIFAGSRLHWPTRSARRPRCRPTSNLATSSGTAAETLYRTIQNDQDHGAADELPFPDRREGDSVRPLQTDQRRILHGRQSSAGRVSRQPFVIEAGLAFGNGPEESAEAATGRRATSGRRRSRRGCGTREGDPVCQPRTVALSAIGLRNVQGRAEHDLAKLWHAAIARGLPAGPMVIFVHMASVWVPFTSESKEAIADYDEIQKEITLALREAGGGWDCSPTPGTGGQRVSAAQHF